jgi:RHS repeat-associated protein
LEPEITELRNITLNTNPNFQPLGFASGLYDFDTKLYRFGARDYDPVIGRWLQRDPIKFDGGTTNLYEYCGNDSVNCVDSSGLAGNPPPPSNQLPITTCDPYNDANCVPDWCEWMPESGLCLNSPFLPPMLVPPYWPPLPTPPIVPSPIRPPYQPTPRTIAPQCGGF